MWYNENRQKTYKYLDEDFKEFVNYLEKIKNMKNIFKLNIQYRKIIKDIHQLINKIIQGLYTLKKTYDEDANIKAKIDSIILTLLDFKNETNNLKLSRYDKNLLFCF